MRGDCIIYGSTEYALTRARFSHNKTYTYYTRVVRPPPFGGLTRATARPLIVPAHHLGSGPTDVFGSLARPSTLPFGGDVPGSGPRNHEVN